MKETIEPATTAVVETQFLTRSEVSRLLGVSPNTVTRWAREGRLSCQVTLGGHHRFDRELVEQLRKGSVRAGNGSMDAAASADNMARPTIRARGR